MCVRNEGLHSSTVYTLDRHKKVYSPAGWENKIAHCRTKQARVSETRRFALIPAYITNRLYTHLSFLPFVKGVPVSVGGFTGEIRDNVSETKSAIGRSFGVQTHVHFRTRLVMIIEEKERERGNETRRNVSKPTSHYLAIEMEDTHMCSRIHRMYHHQKYSLHITYLEVVHGRQTHR